MVICLERGADLHIAQRMPLPLTVSCFSKIQIGFTFLVPAHLGSPGKRTVKRVCVCVRVLQSLLYRVVQKKTHIFSIKHIVATVKDKLKRFSVKYSKSFSNSKIKIRVQFLRSF